MPNEYSSLYPLLIAAVTSLTFRVIMYYDEIVSVSQN